MSEVLASTDKLVNFAQFSALVAQVVESHHELFALCRKSADPYQHFSDTLRTSLKSEHYKLDAENMTSVKEERERRKKLLTRLTSLTDKCDLHIPMVLACLRISFAAQGEATIMMTKTLQGWDKIGFSGIAHKAVHLKNLMTTLETNLKATQGRCKTLELAYQHMVQIDFELKPPPPKEDEPPKEKKRGRPRKQALV